jgi:hypothetical protein
MRSRDVLHGVQALIVASSEGAVPLALLMFGSFGTSEIVCALACATTRGQTHAVKQLLDYDDVVGDALTFSLRAAISAHVSSGSSANNSPISACDTGTPSPSVGPQPPDLPLEPGLLRPFVWAAPPLLHLPAASSLWRSHPHGSLVPCRL